VVQKAKKKPDMKLIFRLKTPFLALFSAFLA
jgi:hypothetical protein